MRTVNTCIIYIDLSLKQLEVQVIANAQCIILNNETINNQIKAKKV
jgi:hypothetical protein